MSGGTILAGALVSGSIYALIALGFALAFRVSSTFNLMHGILLVASGYLHYTFAELIGLPVAVAAGAAIGLIVLVGVAIEALAIPYAKAVGLTPIDLLLVSWLCLIIIEDVLAIAFDSQSIYLGSPLRGGSMAVLGAVITRTQALTVLVSAVVGLAIFVALRWSGGGRHILAVGDDIVLARICGVDVQRILYVNAMLAAFLTAGAGVLMSHQERLDPTLGFRFSIIAIVATLIGQSLGPAGALIGGYLLALFETFVLYFVDPGLRDAAVYGCLFVVVSVTCRANAQLRQG